MKKFTSYAQKRGEWAEKLACRYLKGKDFSILERNYTKRCGEIDIVAQKGGVVHFIEVKSVSRENSMLNPEDHMDFRKLGRLSRTISSYIIENDISSWQMDLLCLIDDRNGKKAYIRRLEDIILPEN